MTSGHPDQTGFHTVPVGFLDRQSDDPEFAQGALLIENNCRRQLTVSLLYGYYQANNFFPIMN